MGNEKNIVSLVESSETQAKERLSYLDVARGIAIIAVIIGHTISNERGIGQYLYSWHIPIFFIISGILFKSNENWKTKSFKEFLISKIKSLLFPYFSFSILVLIYIIIFGYFGELKSYFFLTLTFGGYKTLWFLPALLFAEILFYIVERKATSKMKAVIFVIAFMMGLAFCRIRCYTFSNSFLILAVNLLDVINRAIFGYVFLCVGYYFQAMFSKKISIFKSLLCAVLCFVINYTLFRYNYVDLHYSVIGNPFLYYINALTGSYFVIFVSKYLLAKSKCLAFFGKNSLLIFATHLNFGLIWRSSYISSFIFRNKNFFLVDLFVIIIETILVLIMNRYCRFLFDHKALVKTINRKKQKNKTQI